MSDRFIVTALSTTTYLLVRATADDDGEILGRGSRTEMVALRDSLLSAAATIRRSIGRATRLSLV